MFKTLFRDRLLISLVVASILIKIFSLNPYWVESYYTFGIYPVISRVLRTVLGWIPFSIGDMLYGAATVFLIIKAWKFIRLLAKRQIGQQLSWAVFGKYLKFVFWIYIVFNLFWGLNYDRQGIASQFGLNVQEYTPSELYE